LRGRTSRTDISFNVSVPVLSEHSTSIVAASCNADSRVSNTPLAASVLAPSAAAKVNVAGNATGTADNKELRIYTTTIPTSHRFVTLMHDEMSKSCW